MTPDLFRSKSKLILAFFILLAGVAPLDAQPLVAGDIAFTGYNSSSYGNNFSFVVLRSLNAGTTINFTDIGWNPLTSSLTSTGTDGIFTWTSPNLAQFTEVTIAINNTAGTAISSVSAGTATNPTGGIGTGTGMILSASGDQIFAFTGTQAAPTFIAGIHCNTQIANGTLGTASTLAGWDDIQVSNTVGFAYSANNSHIAPGLTNGVNAIMVVSGTQGAYSEYDADRYNCTGAGTSSSAVALAAAITNLSNWTMNNTGVTIPTGCSFAVTAAPAITTQPVATSICAGGTTSFTVAATNATGYQWQENNGSGFVNITNGGIYSGVTSAVLSISGVSAGMNGYSYRAVISGSSAVNSNSVQLTVTLPGTWLGGSNAAWSNTANWSCGTLPASVTNVTVPAGTTYSPLIDITTAAANNITIASGASLAFTGANNALSIYGTLTNTGLFNPGGGKTVFAGSSQTIPVLTYAALQVNGGGSKTLAGAITVNGTLTLTNGYILTGTNNLTISSTGNIGGATINSFIVVNGTGGLVQNNIGSGGRTGTIAFPVGINTASYTPVYLNNSTGVADNFKVRVINNIYTSYDAGDNPTSSPLTVGEVGRTWLVTEGTPGGSNATLTLQWNSADGLNNFDNSNCALLHYSGNKWHNISGTPGPAAGFDPYTLSAPGVTNFSPFGIGSAAGSIPLPLRLLSFTATRAGDDVTLNWATADEKGLQDFVVEQSEDAGIFTRKTTVWAKNSGSQINEYRFTCHIATMSTMHYYRLRMEEADGTFTYSPISSVAGDDAGPANHFEVYPNPGSGNNLFIHPTTTVTSELRIVIYDMTGRRLYQAIIPAGAANGGEIPIGFKPGAGVFMIKISDNQTSRELRFVGQ